MRPHCSSFWPAGRCVCVVRVLYANISTVWLRGFFFCANVSQSRSDLSSRDCHCLYKNSWLLRHISGRLTKRHTCQHHSLKVLDNQFLFSLVFFCFCSLTIRLGHWTVVHHVHRCAVGNISVLQKSRRRARANPRRM